MSTSEVNEKNGSKSDIESSSIDGVGGDEQVFVEQTQLK